MYRHGWEDNFIIYLTEMGCENMNWDELAQDRILWRF
jgi:hypothetical protein